MATKRETYTLTAEEAAIYDECDGPKAYNLAREIMARFGRTDTEVVHPDGFVWMVFSSND